MQAEERCGLWRRSPGLVRAAVYGSTFRRNPGSRCRRDCNPAGYRWPCPFPHPMAASMYACTVAWRHISGCERLRCSSCKRPLRISLLAATLPIITSRSTLLATEGVRRDTRLDLAASSKLVNACSNWPDDSLGLLDPSHPVTPTRHRPPRRASPNSVGGGLGLPSHSHSQHGPRR